LDEADEISDADGASMRRVEVIEGLEETLLMSLRKLSDCLPKGSEESSELLLLMDLWLHCLTPSFRFSLHLFTF
jgi:hypothetical protein